MQTFQPSIIVGSYSWDEERVPRDEFQLRRRELDHAMDEHGWKAMLVFGDAREHAALAYYTNFVPRLRWAVAILPRGGEPLLLCSNSSRDMPSMKVMTWIGDVQSGWEWGKNFDPYLAKLELGDTADFGIIGGDLMNPVIARQLGASLGNRYRLVSADAMFQPGRSMRTREITLHREACAVTEAAASAMLAAWRDGKTPTQAVIAAERHARMAAAQDVRTLVSADNGRTLAPADGSPRGDGFLGYIAVKFLGFWSELFVSDGSALLPIARKGLDAAVAAFQPDMTGTAVHAKATAAMAPHTLHPMLSHSIGWRIGLSLDDGGHLDTNNNDVPPVGTVYAIHAGVQDKAGGAIRSAMVAMTATGPQLLCRSPE